MDDLAVVYKALADGTRLRILNLLGAGELCVCDLMAVLDMPQSRVSRHLGCLRGAGWVAGRRSGKWMYYRLRGGADAARAALIPAVQASLRECPQASQDLARLGRHLRDKTTGPCPGAGPGSGEDP